MLVSSFFSLKNNYKTKKIYSSCRASKRQFPLALTELPLVNTSERVQFSSPVHSLQDCLILQEDPISLGQWKADWQMKFNVAKCHSMRVTRHQHYKQIHFYYSLHNKTSENVQWAKYLGITIIDNMDWGQHISEISSKATKTLGFLRRNLAFAPMSTKEVAFKTLVRPKLEYATPIWSPYSKFPINQFEKVQKTAARWTCNRWQNTSSVGEMLDELEWQSLEAHRDQPFLLLFDKID